MKRFLLFSFLFALANLLIAQTVTNTYTTLNTGSNGLLDSQVTSFAYGPDGKVWIATKNGFSIYDGSTWTYLNYDDFYPGLDKFVRLFTDSDANLWINQTFAPYQVNYLLLKYNGDSIICFGPTQGYYSSLGEGNFYEDAEGTIYIQQASILLSFKNDTFTNISIPVSNVLHSYDLTNDSCGRLVISSAYRTYRQGFEGWDEIFPSASSEIFTTSDKLICLRSGSYLKFLKCNSVVDSILLPNLPNSNASTGFTIYSSSIEDNQGNIWLYGGYNGLLKYDGQDFTFFNADSLGFATGVFIDELKLNNGKLWFANWLGGIVEWDGSQFNLINTFDGLVENTVKSIVVISDSILFGTQNGYSILNDNTWQSFKYSNAYTNAGASIDDGMGLKINDMHDLGYGKYVFATSNHGLVVKDTSNYGDYLFLNGFLNPAFYYPQKILKGFNDDYWVAHYLGLAHYFGDSTQWANTTNYWENYSSVDGLPNDTVYDLCKDNSGNIWCATENGVALFQNNIFTVYTTSQGLIDNQTRSIYYDSNGTIWVGTIAGLSKFDGFTWQNFTVADGLAGNQVNAIFEDSQNNMWFGTDQGLSKYKNQTWTNYTTAGGLSHNYINSITEDGDGNLWVGTNFGATKLSISQGIEDSDKNNNDFSIYPNPAKDNITISAPSEITKIELYSPTGQLLRKININKKQETLDISGLAPGNYFIRAIGKEDVWVKKFVVVR